MRKNVFVYLLLACICTFCMGSQGCETKIQESSSGAKQITTSKVPKNSKERTVEQQNIDDRIRVTTDPTKVMWIHLIALDGDIIKRMPVRNKITSSGKRLEPTHAADSVNGYFPDAGISNFETDEFLQPDGTYGHSDPYVFWFDPMGRYHQWGTAGGLGYLLTDYPIDLDDPIDKITGLYKVQKEALEWQKVQEEELKKKEKSVSVPTPVQAVVPTSNLKVKP